MLTHSDVACSTFTIDKTYELPDELIATLRAFLMPQDAFAKLVSKESPPKPKMDVQVAEWAIKILAKRELQYPTTIEQDEEEWSKTTLVKSEGRNVQRERMAALVVMEEKRILKQAKKELEEYVAEMRKEDEQEKDAGKGKRKGAAEDAKGGKKKKVAK